MAVVGILDEAQDRIYKCFESNGFQTRSGRQLWDIEKDYKEGPLKK